PCPAVRTARSRRAKPRRGRGGASGLSGSAPLGVPTYSRTGGYVDGRTEGPPRPAQVRDEDRPRPQAPAVDAATHTATRRSVGSAGRRADGAPALAGTSSDDRPASRAAGNKDRTA